MLRLCASKVSSLLFNNMQWSSLPWVVNLKHVSLLDVCIIIPCISLSILSIRFRHHACSSMFSYLLRLLPRFRTSWLYFPNNWGNSRHALYIVSGKEWRRPHMPLLCKQFTKPKKSGEMGRKYKSGTLACLPYTQFR